MENRINDAKDLLSLIDKSPTAFHVIDNAKGILDSAGFKNLKESEVWNLQVGEKYYVTRNDSSLIALSNNLITESLITMAGISPPVKI